MKNKKTIVASLAAIAMSASLACGATYALFTSESTANIAISSGKVNMTAEIENVKLSYLNNIDSEGNGTEVSGRLYAGTATIDGNKITLEKLVPGDKITLDINVYNESNVASKYQTLIGVFEDNGLFDGLVVTLNGNTYNGKTAKSEWNNEAAVSEKTIVETVSVTIELPWNAGNEYQDKSCELYLSVNAVQGNALCTNPVENTVELYTARDLLMFAEDVNENGNSYAGKTVMLMDDIDLNNAAWTPIGQTGGYSAKNYFQGTFDGNGKTISNLNVSVWEEGTDGGKNYASGLFGFIDMGSTTIKNVTFDNANVEGHHWVGVVAGYMTGTIENVVVKNSTVTSTYKTSEADGDKAGGVTGYLNSGSVTGCRVENSTVTAVRDCGSIVGFSTNNGNVTGNTAQDCTVYYSTDDIGKIGGEIAGKRANGVSDNTATNVTVNKLVAITTAEDLVAFAKDVNENGNSYAGKTVMLMNDIDLNNVAWTPIGQTGGYSAKTYFQGTFDGNGKTISNLNVSVWEAGSNEGKNYASGLFGFIDAASATIKNLTVDNAKVVGHHWAGVIAGYLTGDIDNCHVINANVTCKHANDEACGDKAGVIVGYVNSGTVSNCTATNCAVAAGRDAGQIVGAAKTDQVTNCSATNVTVTATEDCTGENIRNDVIGRVL